MRKKICLCGIIVIMCLSAVGCSGNNKTEATETIDTQTMEIRQNDYRGGIMRLQAIKELTLGLVEEMKQNNTSIRTDKPNSYWTEAGYQDFVSTFLATDLIVDTGFFNEEETDWTTVINAMTTTANSFTVLESDGVYAPKYGDLTITRNEKDDYSISGVTTTWNDITCDSLYRCLYDCDKDWVKTSVLLYPSTELPTITGNLLEYGRIDANHFVIQTASERLLVEFEETDTDTDIRDRVIKAFYYTKLSGGKRTTFKPYEFLIETDEFGDAIQENVYKNEQMADYITLFNEDGDSAFSYGAGNSIFLGKNDLSYIDENWVFEDKALSQGIVYKDGVLVVVTYNKLSENYERFIYVKGDVTDSMVDELCNLIQIDGLVGLNEDTALESEEVNESEVDESETDIADTKLPENDTPTVTPIPEKAEVAE